MKSDIKLAIHITDTTIGINKRGKTTDSVAATSGPATSVIIVPSIRCLFALSVGGL